MNEPPGEGVILAVADDGEPKEARVFEGLQKKPRASHRLAVIGDGDDAGIEHLPHLGQVLAFQTLGDGAAGKDTDRAFRPGLFHDVLGHALVIVYRVRVRHADDRRKTAPRRCHGARPDGLLPLVARLPEVRVHIDEAGRHDEAVCVDHLVDLVGGQMLVDAFYGAALDEDVDELIAIGFRVYEAAFSYEDSQPSPPESK